MNAFGFSPAIALRRWWRALLRAPRAAVFTGLLVLAACNGSTVVTLTSTASQDTFLAYRVTLTSVQLQTSSGSSKVQIVPASTVVDLAKLVQLSEIISAAGVTKGTYTGVAITIDYSGAQIVYDDGSSNGVALTAVDASGAALGKTTLTATLDPGGALTVSAGNTSLLALDFKLAASNLVNLSAKTVTVTPFVAASASAIDAKLVRLRGRLQGVDSTNLQFTQSVMPFGGLVLGGGQMTVTPSETTAYEVNGFSNVGSAGLAQLASLSAGAFTVAYGTLTSASSLLTSTATTTTTTTTDGVTTYATPTSTSSTSVSFAATQVLAGSSVQGSGLDRVSGIVSARRGNTITVDDGTLVGDDGTNTFVPGTTVIGIGPNTAVTVLAQAPGFIDTTQQITVGSAVDVFGVASLFSNNATLDASAGRVRLSPSAASGIVNTQVLGLLTLNLSMLGGRSASGLDFLGASTLNLVAGRYSVNAGILNVANAGAGSPVIATGFPTAFGAAGADFTASSLLDPTTIQAQLVVGYGAGTATAFTIDSSALDIDVTNSSIGTQHEIQVGAQIINLIGMAADPLIEPDATGAPALFSIGHASSATVESFNTYGAFVTQLQSELNSAVLVTSVTALGPYTASSYTMAATSITVSLNN